MVVSTMPADDIALLGAKKYKVIKPPILSDT